MLAVVRKMVLTKAIAWPDENDATNPLHALLEYAALDATTASRAAACRC